MTSQDDGRSEEPQRPRGKLPAIVPADAIPPEIRKMALELGIDLSDPKTASVFFRIVTFKSSPYPEIETAREWELIYPGSAKVFIDMPQKQALHRQSMERITTWTDTAIRVLATVTAGVVALSGVWGNHSNAYR